MNAAGTRASGLLAIAIAGVLLFPIAAHVAGQQTTPTPTVEPRRFIQDMTLAGMTEVQVGKIAAERASNPDVRRFATMVVRDASDHNKMLALTAAALDIQTLDQLDVGQLAAIERLGRSQGADVDEEFLQLMVRSHEDHVRRLGAMATSGVSVRPTPSGLARTESEVALWASHTLSVAQHHLRIARDLQAKLR
jgi:putative membrane protein